MKELRVDRHHAFSSTVTLFLKDFGSLWSHAIDAPVSLAMSVANGDGETAKIATNHLDGAVKAGSVTIDARNGHVFPFASIVGFIQRSVGATTFWEG